MQLFKRGYPEADLFLPSKNQKTSVEGWHVLGRWKDDGERTEDDQISLILLTSKAQLRRLAQGASGKDSMTHTHTHHC